jgi:hypothetical protein
VAKRLESVAQQIRESGPFEWRRLRAVTCRVTVGH